MTREFVAATVAAPDRQAGAQFILELAKGFEPLTL